MFSHITLLLGSTKEGKYIVSQCKRTSYSPEVVLDRYLKLQKLKNIASQICNIEIQLYQLFFF